jgi:hypothetical protein
MSVRLDNSRLYSRQFKLHLKGEAARPVPAGYISVNEIEFLLSLAKFVLLIIRIYYMTSIN